jgi:hypothetical protein
MANDHKPAKLLTLAWYIDRRLFENITELIRITCKGLFFFIIIIFHHEFRPGWPVSLPAFTSSSSLFSDHPGHGLPFG